MKLKQLLDQYCYLSVLITAQMSCWMKTIHQSLDIQVCDCILLIKNQSVP